MSTTSFADMNHQPGGVRRVLRFPIVWMVVGIVGVGAVSALTSGGPPVLAVVGAVAAVAVYWLVMRYVAGRRTPEIGWAGSGTQALFGVVLGVVFIAASVLMVVTEFSFTWSSGDALPIMASMAAVSLGGAVTEELLFRGLVLQALERLCGSCPALAITAALFGLLGIPVSGHPAAGLLFTRPTGPDLLTGGEFGIEASIIPVIVSLLLAVPMLIAARRRGNLVPMRRARR